MLIGATGTQRLRGTLEERPSDDPQNPCKARPVLATTNNPFFQHTSCAQKRPRCRGNRRTLEEGFSGAQLSAGPGDGSHFTERFFTPDAHPASTAAAPRFWLDPLLMHVTRCGAPLAFLAQLQRLVLNLQAGALLKVAHACSSPGRSMASARSAFKVSRLSASTSLPINWTEGLAR